MVIRDRLGASLYEGPMHDGQGVALAYNFFKGRLDPSMVFFAITLKPGAYVGYHQHHGNDEIVYVASGKGEYFEDGERHALTSGDTMLLKSGHAHALRNMGDTDLELLGFVGAVGGDIGSVENLPLPAALVAWT